MSMALTLLRLEVQTLGPYTPHMYIYTCTCGTCALTGDMESVTLMLIRLYRTCFHRTEKSGFSDTSLCVSTCGSVCDREFPGNLSDRCAARQECFVLVCLRNPIGHTHTYIHTQRLRRRQSE